MRCTNQGADYSEEDIQWSCTASLPPEFKLGSTDVMCEGFDSPDDPRVLKGSCGVEYRLVLTERGEEKYGSGSWFWSTGKGYEKPSEGWLSSIFPLVFLGVLIWIFYSIYMSWRNQGVRRPAPIGGGWGGGWGGGDDPPPPYPGTSPFHGKRYTSGTEAEGWRPGFWTGALGGAAAGYMAGRGGRQPTMAEVPRTGQWFGVGRRGDGNRNAGSSSTGSSSSSGSSARYESTGFGSTSRR